MSKPSEFDIFKAQLLDGISSERQSEVIREAERGMRALFSSEKGNALLKGIVSELKTSPLMDYNRLLPERPIGPPCPMEIYHAETGLLETRPYRGNPFESTIPNAIWGDYPPLHEVKEKVGFAPIFNGSAATPSVFSPWQEIEEAIAHVKEGFEGIADKVEMNSETLPAFKRKIGETGPRGFSFIESTPVFTDDRLPKGMVLIKNADGEIIARFTGFV